MNFVSNVIIKIASAVSGQSYDQTWQEKIPHLITGLVLLLLFVGIFCLFFYKNFWRDLQARTIFYVTGASLLVLVVTKFVINALVKGYIPDRLVFYAVPSPKASNLFWFVLPIIIFGLFFKFRDKMEELPRRYFLLTLASVFILFTLSISAVRDGLYSVIEPLARTNWEYTGALPLIHSARDFITHYINLLPNLTIRHQNHPPGYTILLYALQYFFHVGYMGMTILLVVIASFMLWPLLSLWERFFSPLAARRMLQLFVFVPSVVLMSATSVEPFFILAVWVALFSCFVGWQKSVGLSILGGLAAALSLFCNFIYTLMPLVFLFLISYHLYKNRKDSLERTKILSRFLVTIVVFSLSFVFLYYWAHYSIVDNFFVAQSLLQTNVPSNFSSLGTYFTYFFMNIVDFGIFLGIPWVYLILKGMTKEKIKQSTIFFKAGIALLCLMLLLGIFQGELGRIWLFMVPFFIGFDHEIFTKEKSLYFKAVLCLLFFQIIIMQTLFYTYW